MLDDKYYYFPLLLGGFTLCGAAVCSIINLLSELSEETEDHLFVENCSR